MYMCLDALVSCVEGGRDSHASRRSGTHARSQPDMLAAVKLSVKDHVCLQAVRCTGGEREVLASMCVQLPTLYCSEHTSTTLAAASTCVKTKAAAPL